jgi:hypothetical protein
MTTRTLPEMYWCTLRPNQGQIVEYSQPQIPGAAEGEEGPGKGLTLRVDHGDQSWSIEDKRLGTIAEGNGTPVPSVAEAIAARKAKRLGGADQ